MGLFDTSKEAQQKDYLKNMINRIIRSRIMAQKTKLKKRVWVFRP